jgi:hypothetical protein
MRRGLFIAGFVLGLLLLAGLGASISLARSTFSLVLERSTTA